MILSMISAVAGRGAFGGPIHQILPKARVTECTTEKIKITYLIYRKAIEWGRVVASCMLATFGASLA